MSDNDSGNRPLMVSAFERHAVAVLAAIATAMLTWIGFTTQQTAVGVARLEEQVKSVQPLATRIESHERRIWELERFH